MPAKRQRILSGIQPSGLLHIGNYIGAVQQWVALQDQPSNECFYCIVDLHAITVRQKPEELREHVLFTAATYLACGLDPKRSVLFVQSEVFEHALLGWVLGTFTQMGELERMTQFKDKAARHAQNINAGLFTYPVLMAADILLYQPALVPVGDDQQQHIELTRDVAERFNKTYKSDVFTLPRALFQKQGSRIMGLDDPTVKMSKSAEQPWNYIALTDAPDVVAKKIKRAVTDSGDEIRAGKDKPALSNLLTIYSSVSGKTIAALEKQYVGVGYGVFKQEMGEAVVSWLTPIQQRIDEYMNDRSQLVEILVDGRARAHSVADKTMRIVYDTVGLGYPTH